MIKVSSFCKTCGSELRHISIRKEDVFGCPKCHAEKSRKQEITLVENTETGEKHLKLNRK